MEISLDDEKTMQLYQEMRELFHREIGLVRGKYHPDFCKALVEHMGNGLTFESFSVIVGVVPSTLDRWVKVYPEFAEARELGKQFCSVDWQIVLKRIARGEIKGNAQAAMFALKNIDSDNFKDSKEITGNGNAPAQIIVNTGIVREAPEAIEAEYRKLDSKKVDYDL